jgi:hypothetical protein|tara:strand:- start:1199 stop:1465 length:267 start_codon:yes stop_codon:yes gene_type:complete
MGRISKKSQEFRRMMAHRYEAAWHECFWGFSEWRQLEVIENPHGDERTHRELAKATRILAEDDSWKPKKDYRAIPTDAKKLRKINNEI